MKLYLFSKTQIYGLNSSEISVAYIPIISTIVIFIQNTVTVKIFITCIPFAIRIYISLVRIWHKEAIVFRISHTIIVFVRITGITSSCNEKIWNDGPFKFTQIYLLNMFMDFWHCLDHWKLPTSGNILVFTLKCQIFQWWRHLEFFFISFELKPDDKTNLALF